MRTIRLTSQTALRLVVNLLTLFLILPLIVNALWQQISLILVPNVVFSPFILMAIGMPVVILLVALTRRSTYFYNNLAITSLAFLIYTCLAAVFNFNDLTFNYIFVGYSVFFYFSFLLFPISFINKFLSYEIVLYVILLTILVCSLLGILQYILNQPIVKIGDASGGFHISSWLFLETNPPRTRGFSLFNSGLEFGIFLTFSVGIIINYIRQQRTIGIFLLVLIIGATFCTLTRNAYLGVILAFAGSLLYQFTCNYRTLLLAPLFSLFIGCLISSGIGSIGQEGIASKDTLSTRNIYWQQEIVRQYRRDTTKLLFGEGYYQTGDENSDTRIFVDNSYLQLVAHIGVIGLILFILVYISLLQYSIREPRNALRSGFYGLLMAWPAIAIFNITIHHIALFALIPLLTANQLSYKGRR